VVLKTVIINVVKIGENVSKKNMSKKGEDEANGTLMIQQLFESPLKLEDIRAYDEPVLSNLRCSLTTDGGILVRPHLLQPSPCRYSMGEGESNQHGYLPWP
jgi:hypothetical protein